MIIIKMLGADADLAPELIKDIHNQVAQAFETEPEEILFLVPNSTLYFRGVDQTSYQLDLEIQAPEKFHPLEEQAAKVLIDIFKESHIHVRILFSYFEQAHEHGFVNEDYPRYMTEENMAHFDKIEEETGDEKPYMGDAFADYGARVKEKEEEQEADEKDRQAARTDKNN